MSVKEKPMRHDPELEHLVNVVIDGLTTINGWAAIALRDPQNPYMQEQALEIIKFTAHQSACHLQDYMRGRGAGGESKR